MSLLLFLLRGRALVNVIGKRLVTFSLQVEVGRMTADAAGARGELSLARYVWPRGFSDDQLACSCSLRMTVYDAEPIRIHGT